MGAVGAVIFFKLASEEMPTNGILWVSVIISAAAWLTAGIRIALSARLQPGEKAKPNTPNQWAVGLIVAGTGPALVGRIVDHYAILWVCSVGLIAFSVGFLSTAVFQISGQGRR